MSITVFKKLISFAKFRIRQILILLVNIGAIGKIKSQVAYIAEKESWAIYWEGVGISEYINKQFATPFVEVTSKVHKVRSPVIHFGSQYMWEIWRDLLPKNSKIIVNFFHGKFEDGLDVAKHISVFISNYEKIEKIIVSNSILHHRLIEWGIPSEKILKIYIGVDTKLFSPNNLETKLKARKRLGFNENDFIIGSFQKDGIGWKNGESPKLIKGPDILVESICKVSKSRDIKLLLTGPSRGYVMNGFEKEGINFKYFRTDDYLEMPDFYKALDLYLITSREEGGPKGLIEALASSIPVVSTPVGMSVDLLPGLTSCRLTHGFDSSEIAKNIIELMDSNELGVSFSYLKATVDKVDYSTISREYFSKVYSPLQSARIK